MKNFCAITLAVLVCFCHGYFAWKLSPRCTHPVKFTLSMMQELPSHMRKPRHICSKIGISAILLFNSPLPCIAQIPSMDDYNAASGTVIRTTSPGATTTTLSSSLGAQEVVRELPFTLDSLQKQIQAEEWDKVINTCKSLKLFKLKYLGYSNGPELATGFGVSKEEALEIETFRNEINAILVQINDLSISNRVYYFNKEDLSLTQQLIEETTTRTGVNPLGENDDEKFNKREEPLALLKEAKQLSNELSKLVQHG